jgi:hypothetical protein
MKPIQGLSVNKSFAPSPQALRRQVPPGWAHAKKSPCPGFVRTGGPDLTDDRKLKPVVILLF